MSFHGTDSKRSQPHPEPVMSRADSPKPQLTSHQQTRVETTSLPLLLVSCSTQGAWPSPLPHFFYPYISPGFPGPLAPFLLHPTFSTHHLPRVRNSCGMLRASCSTSSETSDVIYTPATSEDRNTPEEVAMDEPFVPSQRRAGRTRRPLVSLLTGYHANNNIDKTTAGADNKEKAQMHKQEDEIPRVVPWGYRYTHDDDGSASQIARRVQWLGPDSMLPRPRFTFEDFPARLDIPDAKNTMLEKIGRKVLAVKERMETENNLTHPVVPVAASSDDDNMKQGLPSAGTLEKRDPTSLISLYEQQFKRGKNADEPKTDPRKEAWRFGDALVTEPQMTRHANKLAANFGYSNHRDLMDNFFKIHAQEPESNLVDNLARYLDQAERNKSVAGAYQPRAKFMDPIPTHHYSDGKVDLEEVTKQSKGWNGLNGGMERRLHQDGVVGTGEGGIEHAFSAPDKRTCDVDEPELRRSFATLGLQQYKSVSPSTLTDAYKATLASNTHSAETCDDAASAILHHHMAHAICYDDLHDAADQKRASAAEVGTQEDEEGDQWGSGQVNENGAWGFNNEPQCCVWDRDDKAIPTEWGTMAGQVSSSNDDLYCSPTPPRPRPVGGSSDLDAGSLYCPPTPPRPCPVAGSTGPWGAFSQGCLAPAPRHTGPTATVPWEAVSQGSIARAPRQVGPTAPWEGFSQGSIAGPTGPGWNASHLSSRRPTPTPPSVSTDLKITYWATLESDGKFKDIPLSRANISGPEKEVLDTSMHKVWKWVQDKKLGGTVSLEDAWDLARQMGGVQDTSAEEAKAKAETMVDAAEEKRLQEEFTRMMAPMETNTKEDDEIAQKLQERDVWAWNKQPTLQERNEDSKREWNTVQDDKPQELKNTKEKNIKDGGRNADHDSAFGKSVNDDENNGGVGWQRDARAPHHNFVEDEAKAEDGDAADLDNKVAPFLPKSPSKSIPYFRRTRWDN
ncbi:hypothetical protein BDV95DRAFT_54454 [Massariosphaeria phaeospora]|uniref:Uncharacterized protein n=1 Tax=Massariosphaeria phaeospora TaxID=100035 RepID=A0A7C8ME50_9PLEO|nr:hypothetical protein BDV95DRAFT_54454 [Massariosphaeria phaeospora]